MKEFLEILNPEQLAAAQALNGYIMIKAGAGSGKTRTVVSRVNNLIDHGVDPKNILAITFTNKAAEELKSRLPQGADVTASTIHSFAGRILRAYPPSGFNRYYQIVDANDQTVIIHEIFKGYKNSSDPLMKGVADAMSVRQINLSAVFGFKRISLYNDRSKKAKAEDELIDQLGLFGNFIHFYKRMAEDYKQYLKNHNQMDFDDLLTNAVSVLKTNETALRVYQDRYRHISVDEYQDTTPVQSELISLLADGIDSRNGSLCVVGDVNQSIYSFNGSDVRIFNGFMKTYPNAQVFELGSNYRSTPEIVETANSVLSLPQAHLNNGVTLKSQQSSKAIKPKIIHAKSQRGEARRVIKEIKHLHAKGIAYSDIAILYRANYLSRNYEQELINNNLPYNIIGGLSFMQREEVKDLLAYLHLIINPKDDVSFNRVINKPSRKIGDKLQGIIKTVANSWQMSFFEAIQQLMINQELMQAVGLTTSQVNALAKFYNLYQNVPLDSLSSMAKHFAIESGLYDYYRKIDENSEETDNSKSDNVAEFISMTSSYDNEHSKDMVKDRLNDFLNNAALDSDSQNASGVQMMTVHKSKGLEFEAVFVVDLLEDVFPSKRVFSGTTSQVMKNLAEEWRVFYVAITRPKTWLYLSYSDTQWLWGNTVPANPSRFIDNNVIKQLKEA